MDTYEKLIEIFSDVLKKSNDYHIAYIHQVGYVSLVGLYDQIRKKNLSMKIDEIFLSPEEMAESLLRNWRWQWFYDNRKLLPRTDYDDICDLDGDLPDCLSKQYKQEPQSWQNKIRSILQMEV